MILDKVIIGNSNLKFLKGSKRRVMKIVKRSDYGYDENFNFVHIESGKKLEERVYMVSDKEYESLLAHVEKIIKEVKDVL